MRKIKVLNLLLIVIGWATVGLTLYNMTLQHKSQAEYLYKNKSLVKQVKQLEKFIETPLEEQITFRSYSSLKSLVEVSMLVEIPLETNIKDILFIGDSRFVGMEEANTNGYTFFCEVGKGYSWYIDNLDKIESLISDNTIIIFGLGVNDLSNIENYLKLKNSEYFDQIYYLSVNPVDEVKEAEYGYTVTNNSIDSFNSRVQEVFKDRYIDTNSVLKESGFETKDGLHYTEETYTDIYEYIINNLPLIDKI